MKRVAITGMGALSPLGNNIQDFWKNLTAGQSGAGPITKFDTELFKTRFACELKDFNSEDFFDRKELRKYDPYCQYALVASDQAIEDAGLNFEELDVERIGVIWASGNGGISTFEEQLFEFAQGDGTPPVFPFLHSPHHSGYGCGTDLH